MGKPAPLTLDERVQWHDFAIAVVNASLNDEEQPQPRFLDGDAMPDDVAIFKLAQLVLDIAPDTDLGCQIVRNGGAYQITDECVHISRREWDQLQETLAAFRASTVRR